MIRWLRSHPLLIAYIVIAVGNVAAFRATDTNNDRIHELINKDVARRCISSWESREQIRTAIAIPGEAIVEVATDADPERIAEFRAAVDRRIEEAFPNPDCDLGAARAQLND